MRKSILIIGALLMFAACKVQKTPNKWKYYGSMGEISIWTKPDSVMKFNHKTGNEIKVKSQIYNFNN